MIVILTLCAALAAPPPEATELSEELAGVYIEAMASIKSGDHQKVSDLLGRVNDGAPNFDDAFRNRCAAERFLGNGAEARRLCERAVEIDGYWVNHAALVRDALSGQEYPLAKEYANAALQVHPEQHELLRLLGDAAMRDRDYRTLEKTVTRFDEAHGDDAWGEFYRFVLHNAHCDTDSARASLEKSLQLGLPEQGRRMLARIQPPTSCERNYTVFAAVGGVSVVLLLAIGMFMWRRSR